MQNRLGSADIRAIFDHAWLSKTRWEELETKTLACPLKVQNLRPEGTAQGRTENFSMDVDYNVEGFTWRGKSPLHN